MARSLLSIELRAGDEDAQFPATGQDFCADSEAKNAQTTEKQKPRQPVGAPLFLSFPFIPSAPPHRTLKKAICLDQISPKCSPLDLMYTLGTHKRSVYL